MLGIFDSEENILGVTQESRARGFKIVDVYTPYAVHGLDKAMGVKRSRLPWVCFLLGVVGAVSKVWFEFWTSAVDWAINVGGKPWNSLPAFVPVTFEVMVLFAGLSVVLAFFLVARLFPGKKPKMLDPAITNDHFVLVLEQTDAAFDPVEVKTMFESFKAVGVEERVE